MFKKLSNLPSIVYVILIPIAIAVLIGGVIFLFTTIATVEGAASILFLVIGFIIVFTGGSSKIKFGGVKSATTSFSIAVGIVFFALMGMAIDQTGNVFYNYPIQVLNCPTGSYLTRESIITNPLPGRTDINEDFNCVANNKVVQSIDIGNVLVIRFIEYVIIGYAFRALSFLINLIKKNWAVADNQII